MYSELFERVLKEAQLEETIAIESGRIYIFQTEEEKLKTIDELWEYHKKEALQKIKDKIWQSVIVQNTDPPLEIQIYPSCIGEILHHTPKQEEFRPKILCLQALPYIIQKTNHIELKSERKNNPHNEYWYHGFCNIIIDKISYSATVKFVKRFDNKNPRFYIYFIDDLDLKRR